MGSVPSPNITVHLIWYGSWSSVVESSGNLHGHNGFRSDTVSHSGTGKERPFSVPRSKVTRLAVQSVISTAIRAKTNPLPTDPNGGLYLVLTSSDILVEGLCQSIFGFHYFTFPSILGYTFPFAWVGNSEKMCASLCVFPFVVPKYMHGVKALKPPNGQPGEDAMISVIGHELAELATIFLRNGWYGGNDPYFQTGVGDYVKDSMAAGAAGHT
ncbi:putative protein EXORDIUM [Helianthus anomalus]